MSGDAIGQTAPKLNYEVGDTAPFNTICGPTGSGVVLKAFMSGGPELGQAAFDEQVAAGECLSFGYSLWAEITAINYIGVFHKYHLFAIRFGRDGFHINYFGPYESPHFSPNTNGRGRRLRQIGREA